MIIPGKNFVQFHPGIVEDLDAKLGEARISSDFRSVGEIALLAKEHAEPMTRAAGSLVCELLTTVSALQDDPAVNRCIPTAPEPPTLYFERRISDRDIGKKVAAALHPRLQVRNIAAHAARLECYDALPSTYALCMYVDMEPNPYIDRLFSSVFVSTTTMNARKGGAERHGIWFIKGLLHGETAEHDALSQLEDIRTWSTALAAPSALPLTED